MAPSPALSALSEDDLFGVARRPSGYETIETVPVHRIADSPEHDNDSMAALPPLPQSQYSQAHSRSPPTGDGPSQYVTQPTQILRRSSGPGDITDLSSPPPTRPTVQVAASSPMTAQPPKPKSGGSQTGVLGKAMNMMAPAGARLNPQYNRPAPDQLEQPSYSPPHQSISRPIEFPTDPASSDSDQAERERNSIRPRHFTAPGNKPPPPTGDTFSVLMKDFGYQPSYPQQPQGVKRPGDGLASAYGSASKRPRQSAPSRAQPVQQAQSPSHSHYNTPRDLEINDIADPNLRNKVKRIKLVCTTNSVQQCHDAIIDCGGNYDVAVDKLLLLSDRKQPPHNSKNRPIVLPGSDDELMMTPARPPKGVAMSTQMPPQPSQQIRRAPVKSIAQRYTGTQHQTIAPAPPRVLHAFDTPPPQEPKKRGLVRGRKNRSPSPASRAANAKKAIVLDDSGDEVDSGVQSGFGDANFDARVLTFFNTCTPLELTDMSSIPKDHAEHFVSCRPFKTLQSVFNVQNPNNKNKSKKANSSFGERIWDKVYEMMRAYEAVDVCVKKCENMSKPLARSMGNWGVDVYGKGKSDPGLDLVNLPTGSSPDSQGKDSGIGTPISDDGRPNNLAKKGFVPQPPSLATGVQMKDYQVVGLNWLSLLYKAGLSGILADDMGLGKTLQTIAFLAHLKETGEGGPHLIVVPSATLENWLKEFQKFAPDMNVAPYYGSIPERESMRAEYEATRDTLNVIVTTYQIAKAKDDIPWLRRFGFTCAIFDEGHMLKNPTSEVSTKLIRIHSRFRLLLTGTPLQNNLNELMGLLKFLMPHVFAEVEEDLSAIFKQSISVTTEGSSDSRSMLLSKQRIDRARSMLTPFILRRKKWQVLKDLPKKTRHVEICSMSPEQTEIYNQQLAKAWDVRERKAAGIRVPADESANILIRLRQAAIHPLLFRYFYTDKTLRKIAKTCPRIDQFSMSNPDLILTELVAYADFETHELCSKHELLNSYLLPPENWETSGKVLKLLELLARFKADGHKTLVFSQFVMVLDILRIILRNHSIPFLRLDGSTKVDERQDLIDEFNAEDSEFEVFMLSTKAGGAGINLTGASRVVVFDSGFNPQDDVQAENRCHRIGQTKDVEIYRLVSEGSVEEQIYEMGKVKLQLDKEVSGADGGETGQAVDLSMSGIATPTELDDNADGAAKKGRPKKDDSGLNKREQEGAAMIEDMLFRKLEETGRTPEKLAGPSSQSQSQKSNGVGVGGSKLKQEIKAEPNIKKEKPTSKSRTARLSLDGAADTPGDADSPLTSLANSTSSSDLSDAAEIDSSSDEKLPLRSKSRTTKKESLSSSQVQGTDSKGQTGGRSRRKAAEKASENLRDPCDGPDPYVVKVGRGKRGVKDEGGKERGKGQTTISRSGRVVRGWGSEANSSVRLIAHGVKNFGRVWHGTARLKSNARMQQSCWQAGSR